MSKIGKLITPSGATVYLPGKMPFTMDSSHKYYSKLLAAMKSDNVKAISDIIDITKQANTFLQGKAQVIDGEVFYNGEVVSSVLTERIIQMLTEGMDAKPMLKFLENLMQNPSFTARKELYLFLEACGDLPITSDGRFIAYKWVGNDYMDKHTGTFDNRVGQTPKVKRKDVDDDRNNTCSYGLHVCSFKYCKFGERLMLVAVNPRDVVSVPCDYDNGKMRVCEYEVIDEVKDAEYTQFNTSVYDVEDSESEDEDDYEVASYEDDEDFYNSDSDEDDED